MRSSRPNTNPSVNRSTNPIRKVKGIIRRTNTFPKGRTPLESLKNLPSLIGSEIVVGALDVDYLILLESLADSAMIDLVEVINDPEVVFLKPPSVIETSTLPAIEIRKGSGGLSETLRTVDLAGAKGLILVADKSVLSSTPGWDVQIQGSPTEIRNYEVLIDTGLKWQRVSTPQGGYQTRLLPLPNYQAATNYLRVSEASSPLVILPAPLTELLTESVTFDRIIKQFPQYMGVVEKSIEKWLPQSIDEFRREFSHRKETQDFSLGPKTSSILNDGLREGYRPDLLLHTLLLIDRYDYSLFQIPPQTDEGGNSFNLIITSRRRLNEVKGGDPVDTLLRIASAWPPTSQLSTWSREMGLNSEWVARLEDDYQRIAAHLPKTGGLRDPSPEWFRQKFQNYYSDLSPKLITNSKNVQSLQYDDRRVVIGMEIPFEGISPDSLERVLPLNYEAIGDQWIVNLYLIK